MKKKTVSKDSRFGRLNQTDIKRWGKNSLIFAAPAAILFIETYQRTGNIQAASIALQVWAVNTILDLLRKLGAGSR